MYLITQCSWQGRRKCRFCPCNFRDDTSKWSHFLDLCVKWRACGGESSLVQVEEPYNSLHDCVGCYPEKLFESRHGKKPVTNWAVQLQNMARGLKFQV